MNNHNNTDQLEEAFRELDRLKQLITQRDNKLKQQTIDHEKQITSLQNRFVQDQEQLKQDILKFMLHNNELTQQLSQIRINNEVILNEMEEVKHDRDSKLKTLLDIVDKKDKQIRLLEQQVIEGKEIQQCQEHKGYDYNRQLNDKIAKLKQELNTSNNREQQLKQKLTSLIDSNDTMKERIEKLESMNKYSIKEQNSQAKLMSSSQLAKMSLDYENQLMVHRETEENMRQQVDKLTIQVMKLKQSKQQVMDELDQANIKINELLLVCEKISVVEEQCTKLKQKLKQNEEKSTKLERNYNLEIAALQVQLEELGKHHNKNGVQKEQFIKLENKMSALVAENEEYKQTIKNLNQQLSQIEQNYIETVDKQRKTNLDLSQREFELQTIIQSQQSNFLEREREMMDAYRCMNNQLNELQGQYRNLMDKDQDMALRLKLIRGKKTSQTSARLSPPTKLPSSPVLTQESPSKYQTIQKRIDRNVYLKG